MEVSTQIELDLAYASEKVLNLEILMMQVSDIAIDYEILMKGPKELLTESIEKSFQFDILSGFLNSEVKEIECFMSSLQMDLMNAHEKFIGGEHNREDFLLKIEESLHLAEESLKNSKDQVVDIKRQSDKFEKSLAFGTSICKIDNGEYSQMNSKWKLQTVEQQRHFLISLEKSLAREMDFEKKLSESRCNEEELKIKLRFAEKHAYHIEELIEEMMIKLFTAEIYVEVLSGISKEFMRKLHIDQFITSTTQWGGESNMPKRFTDLSVAAADLMTSKTINFGLNGFPMFSEIGPRTTLKECIATSSKVPDLGERVNVPDEQLRESETQLQLNGAYFSENGNQPNVLYPESSNVENVIEGLKEHVLNMQGRAGSAEEWYVQLMKANIKLKDEVEFLKCNEAKKITFMEKKLKESNMQLEHANASLEAIQESQKMLYTSLNDMEHLIGDLKGKVSKAEKRAENAEAKCILPTDTNLELNEELLFLRGRLETLEASLHQAEMEKIATVKNVGNRSRIIVELVKKLAFERERLQLQISVLTKRNKILTEKFLRSEGNISLNYEKLNDSTVNINTKDETLAETLSTCFQAGELATIHEFTDLAASAAEKSVPSIEVVRTIDAAQLNRKYFLMAFLLLLLSILSLFFFQPTHS